MKQKKRDWREYKNSKPLSMFHDDSPGEKDLELGVRLVCAGKLLPNREEFSISHRRSNEVAQVYAAKHAKYYSHRLQDWRKSIKSNRGILGCCSRAAAQADMLKTPVEDYIEAQFWFFDEVFSRAPTYKDIAAAGAMLRWKKWRVALYHDGIPRTTVSKVRGQSDPRKTEKEVLIAYEQKVLERMIQQWGSEEKVWEMFGELGNEEVFSDAFKNSREIWRKMFS